MRRPDAAFLSSHRAWLEDILTRRIPMGGHMGVAIERLDDTGITLSAPLDANVNDKGTAFGGSLVSLMILAGWSLLRLQLEHAGARAELVIARAESRFLAPVDGPMQATCAWPPDSELVRFDQRLAERGRASLALTPRLRQDKVLAAELQARYAALAVDSSESPREVHRA